MSLFNKLYNATKETIAEGKKPFVEKKVKRGFESAIDSLEEKKMDYIEKIDGLREKIANGDQSKIKELAQLKIEMIDFDDQIKALKEEKKEFFGE